MSHQPAVYSFTLWPISQSWNSYGMARWVTTGITLTTLGECLACIRTTWGKRDPATQVEPCVVALICDQYDGRCRTGRNIERQVDEL